MGCSDQVKLLGVWSSPFNRRVELALRLKGIEYDYREDDLYNKSTLLLESNPVYKRIPVLFHRGKAIPESLIIVEYIEDTWGGYPLLPKDPLEKAKARRLAKFIDDECVYAMWMSCWNDGEVQKYYMEQAKEKIYILEAELQGKRFFGGESIDIVDIAANLLTIWADVLQEMAGICIISEQKHPVLWAWSLEFLNSDVVKKCTPDREKLLAMFQDMKATDSYLIYRK